MFHKQIDNLIDYTETSDVKIVFWWPTSFLWKNSELDLGYWTAQNKAWFQDHLAKIAKAK
ncbi:uncharacterized protein PHACADRAFT_95539 [Phanerochaete carnosa HHB-10118-sp]|uniref:Uncharacterized protein n=1 Tax=Phanerochaete carnosa (strain HHB-10118-sp) TaxID=650164 RepID=K5WA40_PHACS|nr:uncharacterized protein PHACADRAFT_95539 [Phanerochaete carnosa HHB-10118-sp]EKM55814.1 hypothetical protein PHACADRAFT_95539 [Phanerochaete carnosa HHB-10118-sp]